jgi:hypothetical protein
MKTLDQSEIQEVCGGSLGQILAGIRSQDIFDIAGVPHVDDRVASGNIGFSLSCMVPLSKVDYSLTATFGRYLNRLEPYVSFRGILSPLAGLIDESL